MAWVPLPRENPFKLIFYLRLIDSMWYFAYSSNMNRQQIEARVLRRSFSRVNKSEGLPFFYVVE